ncbi:MAG TPA: DUF3987 domain-containing protein [Thiobacillus sp.]|nr:MAG: hypothetical protein B7Y27_11115 [Hydrogenophilales bacterium 16-64-40]OZA32763.1 MAG: hypothetical protein B7X82_11590 [Hydrogenophilales bacterium 17-64-65]HQS81549.1 DUF3987 domain-containing protein [Thiobacillus sp.]HQT34820.1 DUF3987 domain-containing protein [Thiobacillus sp.]
MNQDKEKAACELGSTEAALKNSRSNNRQSSEVAQDFSAIPGDLASRQQWLVWRFESKPGDKKPRKIPYYCNGKRRTGEQGAESDRAALVDLATARAAMAKGKYSGVGMALLPGDGLVGIDLDAMIDPDTGEMCERGGAIIAACGSYTEFSPSGKGVHIICSGTTDTFKSNEIGVEVFCGRQYFTFTGHRYPATPGTVNPLPEKVLKRLKATVDGGRKRAVDNKPATAPTPAQEGCAKVESALAYVSPDCGNDDWVKAGMAIQAELGEAGFSVWNTWSMKSDKYPGEAELRQRWKSFKPGAGITGATLFKLAMGAGWRAPRPVHTQAPPAARSSILGDSGAAADGGNWDKPLPFNRIETPELPTDLLPGVFGEYAAALSEALQTPPTMAVLFTLSVFGLALQRKFKVSPFGDDYSEPVCIWTVILADSGERKSALIQRLLKPVLLKEAKLADQMRTEIVERDTLRKISQRRAEKLQADAAKEDSAVRRGELVREITDLAEQTPDELRPPRFFTGDVTPERLQGMLVEHDGRMAVMSDEGGIFAVLAGLYSGGESVVDVALQSYSGSAVRVDRGSRTAVIDRPALTFGLGMQPGLLQDMAPAAKRKFRSSGTFARFFFGLPASRIGRRDMGRRVTISTDLEARYRGEVLRLLELGPRTDAAEGEDDEHVLLLSDVARDLWVKFAQKIENEQAEGGPLESMRDWCAKLPGGALRVAGLFHVAGHGKPAEAISEDTMKRAVGLCLRLIRHAQAVFDLIGADPATDDAKVCWRWIERKGEPEFLRSDLHRAHHTRFDKIDRLVVALETLKTRNLITGPHKGTATGGRPPIYYLVNPLAMKGAE